MSGSARREGISESARPMALPQTVRHQNHIWATLRQNRHAQVRRSQAIGLKQLAKIRERKNQVLPPKGLSQAEGPMINDGTEMSSSSSRSANFSMRRRWSRLVHSGRRILRNLVTLVEDQIPRQKIVSLASSCCWKHGMHGASAPSR